MWNFSYYHQMHFKIISSAWVFFSSVEIHCFSWIHIKQCGECAFGCTYYSITFNKWRNYHQNYSEEFRVFVTAAASAVIWLNVAYRVSSGAIADINCGNHLPFYRLYHTHSTVSMNANEFESNSRCLSHEFIVVVFCESQTKRATKMTVTKRKYNIQMFTK